MATNKIEAQDPQPPNEGEENEKIFSSGVDDALSFAIGGDEVTWTRDEERRILWKIDLLLVPLVRFTVWGRKWKALD